MAIMQDALIEHKLILRFQNIPKEHSSEDIRTGRHFLRRDLSLKKSIMGSRRIEGSKGCYNESPIILSVNTAQPFARLALGARISYNRNESFELKSKGLYFECLNYLY
jgi:hypothetical protein